MGIDFRIHGNPKKLTVELAHDHKKSSRYAQYLHWIL